MLLLLFSSSGKVGGGGAVPRVEYLPETFAVFLGALMKQQFDG